MRIVIEAMSKWLESQRIPRIEFRLNNERIEQAKP